MDREQLQSIVDNTMAHLKDFQCATVERIDELFRHGQTRILVADEVGLGKTLIARGVIAKTALIQERSDKDIFKIVYICSNQVIANQNIQKLDVFNIRPERNNSDSRLSMQHLKIAEQDNSTKEKGAFAQLIPLTPGTSFSMTNGGGTKEERALMYAILSRIPALKGLANDINPFMSMNVNGWNGLVFHYSNRVQELADAGTGYPANVIDRIIAFDGKFHIFDTLIQHVQQIKNNEVCAESHNSVLMKLRKMFAEISVDMLKPDLVIMDEFQRFKYLIDSDALATETGIIARKLFGTENLKVLLLSATPYKLYSTLEDIEEAENPEEYYREFLQVFDFLFNDKNRMDKFKKEWSEYSAALRKMIQGDPVVVELKEKAENEMYGAMCRTERLSAMDSGDFLCDSDAHALSITEGDIRSYYDIGHLLKSIGKDQYLLVDYAKSAPYLMSYMNHYKVKEEVEKWFRLHPDELAMANSKYLWIDRSQLEHYGYLPANNLRIEELKRQIFRNRSELYMWVPPSKPYYELEGVCKDSTGFSKILVFSTWEMVPRAIGSMISYEVERRTVGVLSNSKELKSTNNTYFTPAKSRYPVGRLRFGGTFGDESRLRGMYLFCLLYPSDTLAAIYNPIDYLNAGYSLREIREDLKQKIQKLLNPFIKKYERYSTREDKKWYYLAPAILDGKEYFDKWIAAMQSVSLDADDTTEEAGSSGLYAHLKRMRDLMNSLETVLGRVPRDLAEVLADMAIGSFAVCAFRTNGGDLRRASELAKTFINRFNSTEATAIVMLSYNEDENTEGDGHWRNVLRYACDGGFGAMLDEYVHMVSEGTGYGAAKDEETEAKNEQIHETMVNALKIHTARYLVETYPAFELRMQGKDYQRTYMRSHFAVAFAKGEGDETQSVERKERIRNAFNSPLRPFVLATTSIGQEGLDFHQYCRKIMHWNLPANPVDLEQREGRINRYKCLAIRQHLGEYYDNIIYDSDVWQELFATAEENARAAGKSELVPYWCPEEKQSVKIERIVPMYPFSKDEVNYQRLIKVLSLYRLTMGQARQEELINYILENDFDKTEMHSLFFDLSPYSRTSEEWRIKTRAREPVVVQKKKTERQLRIEKLQNDLKTYEKQKKVVLGKIGTLKKYKTVEMVVHQDKHGEGIITAVDDNYVYVDFTENGYQGKYYKYAAFLKGNLVSEYDGYKEYVAEYSELESKLNDLDKRIGETQSELTKLMV